MDIILGWILAIVIIFMAGVSILTFVSVNIHWWIRDLISFLKPTKTKKI